MKILYFGTVCDLDKYSEKLKGCKSIPSIAPIIFESSLLDGFKKNDVSVEIHSFPMIPTFPHSKFLYFKNIKEKLSCGYEYTWLKTINLPFIKQISRRLSAKKVMKKWLKDAKEEDVIITYSLPPFMIKDIVKMGKKYSVKIIGIVADLLKDMYVNDRDNKILASIKNAYINKALNYQDQYDGYVFLTEAMHNIVAPKKPFIVMEGIANQVNEYDIQDIKKSYPRGIMYAGMVHEKYGILNLIDAFEMLSFSDVELWIFGNGNIISKIKEKAILNPKIKYFGQVEHKKIVEYERKATLLVNPRDASEDFTMYSFPSKTIEYMLSGTPLLTTKLKGIPEEYFEYVFTSQNNDVASLYNCLNDILIQDENDLKMFGLKALKFINSEKNSTKQAERVIEFIKEV